jgi:hypothetical protein
MLGIGGNNSMGIVPGQNGMSMTEVTPGVPSFVRPGDVAYLVPQLDQTTPRTLVASQLVIYKSVPIDAMAR